MIDTYGRNIHKLRIQLLDACQFRCIYCMPESPKFTSLSSLMSKDQIISIVKNLMQFGIDEVRLTGGEPLLRPDFLDIADEISKLDLKKIGLTTNGLKLNSVIDQLKNTEVKHLNISLDTLDEKKFYFITKNNNFKEVYTSILRAKELGFHVKVNVVALRGINDDEILDFIHFASRYDLNVRFLELMNVGVGRKIFQDSFMSADEVEEKVRNLVDLKPINNPRDNTAYEFQLPKLGVLGFIASETKEFCNSCSRLRLSARGDLRPCLFMNEGTNLVGKNIVETGRILQKVIARKPFERIQEISQPMFSIGG